MLPVWIITGFLVYPSYQQNNSTDNSTSTDDFDYSRCPTGCIFDGSILYSDSIKNFPKKCSTVCAPDALYIGYETDLTEKQLTSTFKNLKHLIGSLYMFRSKFKSASFLSGLETIECDNIGFFKISLNDKMTEIGMPNLTNVSCRVEITANVKLLKLNLPLMKPMYSLTANYTRIDVDIENNSENFCITIQEMSNLQSNKDIVFGLNGISGKYCPASKSDVALGTLCNIENSTLSEINSTCVNLVGDLIIDESNEEHVQKLNSVESIFGSLTIDNTNLTSIDFLSKLKNIVSLKENHLAIRVEYNSELTNVSFPEIQRVESRVYVPIVFNNNSQELLMSPSFCNDIRNNLSGNKSWVVKFDNKVCDDIEEVSDVEKYARTTDIPTLMLILYCFYRIFT
ncbi:Receptor L-domain domain-containing protein [Caenorhabditis elegans]|uniref:Receptor L-domain domain-containing protein n=1 Tax=Caenorhabditis elegans TaxID=6239 RepID=M1ZJZ8_CAEEL|nr:Receptor L-domain domain-containing protein [Caenorhabditis elegans]CCU83350.2 Receptor L-domain domain-containing protein [Caenorhabditis elegans]|eukprot:NP_001294741.2 Insulin/EGF-Receptor L Domain protein [Caenorhabditis elegans]